MTDAYQSEGHALSYDELMNVSGIDSLSNSDLLDKIAQLFDQSHDLSKSEGTEHAFSWCDHLAQRDLSDDEAILLAYYRANGWANRQIHHATNEIMEGQILELHRAANHPAFKKFPKLRKCQVLTNLGNQLSSVGRVIEALECWDRALEINPKFGMTIGNRGSGIFKPYMTSAIIWNINSLVSIK